MESNIHPDIRRMIFDTLLNHSHASRTVATEEISELFNKELAALRARCDKYEKERHEMRLAMRMLLKAFKGDIKTERHKEWYAKAEAIFNKHHQVTDVLRNEALSSEGKEVENGKAWDEWRDSLIKHNNVLVHMLKLDGLETIRF